MAKKVLVLTDSLGLPREKPEVCAYEQTWPVLLKQNSDFIVHQVSIGGGTSSDLVRQIEYHQSFNPDIVIVQVGIVDCAPRFMTRLELEIVKKIPFLGRKLIKSLNNNTVRKFRNISYCSPKAFENNINKIQHAFKDKEVFFIGILPAADTYESILPGISANIKLYNKILSGQQGFLPMDLIPSSCIMSDHHHLNANGHTFVYSKILQQINS